MFSLTTHERKVLILLIVALAIGAAIKYLSLYRAQAESIAVPELPRVNINSASQEQLVQLPGIGPVCARRIVEYRTNTLRFYSPDDLTKVKGVSQKIVARLKSRIKFEDQ